MKEIEFRQWPEVLAQADLPERQKASLADQGLLLPNPNVRLRERLHEVMRFYHRVRVGDDWSRLTPAATESRPRGEN